MKKLVLLIILMHSFLFYPAPSFPQVETESSRAETEDDQIYNHYRDMDKAYEGPLPWEDNIKFKEAVKKHGTPVLMAAYKATLRDPIAAEGYNIGLAADQLAGKVVRPGEIFSQNGAIGPYTRQRGYQAGPTYSGNTLVTTVGGGVCKIATMLYNVVTFSDLAVVMRYAHSMTVPYVPPGQDATVYYGSRDFRFMNDTDGPVLIWSQRVNDTLYMALYGTRKPPRVVWHHKVLKKTKYWTLHRYNGSLPDGKETVEAPGQDGYVVRSWVTLENPDGTVTSKKKGISYYSASPRVIEHGRRKSFIENIIHFSRKTLQ